MIETSLVFVLNKKVTTFISSLKCNTVNVDVAPESKLF